MKLCVISGDGVGEEVVPAAVLVLKEVLPELEIIEAEAGWGVFQSTGVALPDETLAKAKESGAVLFGAVSSPLHVVDGYRSPIVALRRSLDTFANIRPAKKLLEEESPVDLLVVRENTEGLYTGAEKAEKLVNGSARVVTERVITEHGSKRIARLAFQIAKDTKRRLTVIHKANVIRQGDGLWRKSCLEVAKEFKDVVVTEGLVDSAAYHMVRNPSSYDLLLCPNLYGDILSDVASGLADGLGLAPSISIGNGFAIAEPVHGSAPDIAGKGIANPIAAILSAAMLCRYHWKCPEIANVIEKSVSIALKQGFRTPDFGGSNNTSEITEAVLSAIRSLK